MILYGKKLTPRQIVWLSIYYGIAYHLPGNGIPFVGRFFRGIRYICVKNLFRYCGVGVNVERRAFFGSGQDLEIGDFSGLGENCTIPGNTIIGRYVMMGPNCYILDANHRFEDITRPMVIQGTYDALRTIIEDDVWIGRGVMMTPGRRVARGMIVGMGCVLTKDFPEFSIVGGNPAKLIRSRCGVNKNNLEHS